jgi:hypothetical protein
MGLWDIFYYVFLWLFAGWPASVFDQDVLFLIPLRYWPTRPYACWLSWLALC